MRIEKEYFVFCEHFDWYTFDTKKGYVPTDIAPDYAKQAMAIYNAIHGFKA